MSYTIESIEGIGPAYARKLRSAGITNTKHLLEKCCDRKGRRHASEASGVSEGKILKWANLADLMRIRGVGTQYSELLEAAGVDTVKELRRRKAENLHAALAAANDTKKLTRKLPPLATLQGWIESAKSMTPVIRH